MPSTGRRRMICTHALTKATLQPWRATLRPLKPELEPTSRNRLSSPAHASRSRLSIADVTRRSPLDVQIQPPTMPVLAMRKRESDHVASSKPYRLSTPASYVSGTACWLAARPARLAREVGRGAAHARRGSARRGAAVAQATHVASAMHAHGTRRRRVGMVVASAVVDVRGAGRGVRAARKKRWCCGKITSLLCD